MASSKTISSATAVGVFLKYPEPGKVKTRLASSVGSKRAAELYTQMVGDVFSQLSQLSDSFQTTVLYDPFRDVSAYRQLWSNYPFNWNEQSEGDLGERLTHAFTELLETNTSAIAVGTDCVEIRHSHIQLAREKMERGADVVIGPALDGGYYLIGMRKLHKTLFEGINWSTDQVLAQTLQRIEATRLSVDLLPELRDIDTIEDLTACGYSV